MGGRYPDVREVSYSIRKKSSNCVGFSYIIRKPPSCEIERISPQAEGIPYSVIF